MTQEQLAILGDMISQEIKRDFEIYFLSGNLRDTIRMTQEEGKVILEVPADRYDIQKFMNEGVKIYTGKGSYAAAVDIFGGFSKQHIDYSGRAVDKAIQQWMNWFNIEGTIKKG